VAHTAQFHRVALYPVVQGEELCAVLTVALTTAGAWTETQ